MHKSLTKGGTLMFVIGLALGLFWAWGWIEGIPAFSPQTQPLGLALASLSLGALFTALLWGVTAFVDKTYDFVGIARAWNAESSVDLPPLPEWYPSVTVDTSTVLRTHRFDTQDYVKTRLRMTALGLAIAMPVFFWVYSSRLTFESDASNALFVTALVATCILVVGPVIVAMGIWLPLHIKRHRMEVHPGGVTIFNAFGSTTFENSAATLKYFAWGLPPEDYLYDLGDDSESPAATEGMVQAHYLIDRVTGAKALVWNLEYSVHEDFGSAGGALDKIVELEEPDSRVRSLMPLTVTQPVLISVLALWYVCTIAAVAAILTT